MFQLETVTEVTFTNANLRAEFHGEEHVQAIDLSVSIEGGNELLDLIQPGLLVHHYTNRAATQGQDQLPEMIAALPNLRHPKLPTVYRYGKDEKPRGYRLEIDHGLGDRNLVLEDCVRGSLSYEIFEGGSVRVDTVLQYNGERLTDNAFLGRLASLPTQGQAHILLQAPAELVLVKGKGWRSGKADAPAQTDGGGELFDGAEPGPGHNDQDDIGEGEEHPEGSPEAALAATESPSDVIPADADAAWPFPQSAHSEKPKRGRGRKESAEVGHVRAAAAA